MTEDYIVKKNVYTIRGKETQTLYMTLYYAMYRYNIIKTPDKHTERDKELSHILISDKTINSVCIYVAEEKLYSMDTKSALQVVSKLQGYAKLLLKYANIKRVILVIFNDLMQSNVLMNFERCDPKLLI